MEDKSIGRNVEMGKDPCLVCPENAHSQVGPPGRGLGNSALGRFTGPQRNIHRYCYTGASQCTAHLSHPP